MNENLMKKHKETVRIVILLNILAVYLLWCVVGFGLFWFCFILGGLFVYFCSSLKKETIQRILKAADMSVLSKPKYLFYQV